MCGASLTSTRFAGSRFPYDARAVRRTVIFAGSNFADHKQNHQNKHKAAHAAPVVKRPSADSTKAAQQCDHQDDENNGPN